MPSEFVAFVDEAGCSGGKFGNGSSQFLVMGAVVVRRVNLDHTIALFAEARDERDKAGKAFRKFARASDKDNFVLTRRLGQKPVRAAFVGFHKPSLEGTFIRDNHGNEYNYMTKFLLERISWIVRDAQSAGGNHKADIVFSHQDMYPMTELASYIKKLKRGSGRYNTRANWEHLADIHDEPHRDEGNMHLADLAASSFHMALEPKQHGMTDERYLRNLLPRLYRGREEKPFGMKIWPEAAVVTATSEGRLAFLAGL